MKQFKLLGLMTLLYIFFIGCNGKVISTSNTNTNTNTDTKLTVGVVQKEIKKGMTQSEVASSLGSPNIVTREEEDKEIWIYDKISSTIDYQQSSQYGTLILIGSSSTSISTQSNQKTLTVIIKFKKGKVYEYKYHSSSF